MLKFIFSLVIIASMSIQLPAQSRVDTLALVTQWIKENAVPFETVDPQRAFKDTSFWSSLIGDSRIVALGEGTHGTKEFYQIKDKLVRFLVEHKDFDALLMEHDYVAGLKIEEAIVHHNQDSLEQRMNLVRGFNWNTQEVLDMLLWIQTYNRTISADQGLEYIGIDMLDTYYEISLVLSILNESRLDFYSMISERISNLFGFIPDSDRKQRTQYNRQLYSEFSIEQLYEFHASVNWLRDVFQKNRYLFLQSVGHEKYNQGLQASEIVLQRAEHLIQFANYYPSIGSRKLNMLSSSAGEISKTLEEFFQRTDQEFFEEIEPITSFFENGFRARQNFISDFDNGKRYDFYHMLNKIKSRLSIRAAFYKKLASNAEIEKTVAAIDELIQLYDAFLDYFRIDFDQVNVREISLADNVSTFGHENGEAKKVITWAHNMHVAKGSYREGPTMGKLLGEKYGEDMLVIGTFFNKGGFQAIDPNSDSRGVREFFMDNSREDTFEHLLSTLNINSFTLDLRTIPKSGPVFEWFQKPRTLKWIGNTYFKGVDRLTYVESTLPDEFDVIIYIDETSRAVPTQGAKMKYNFLEN